MTVRTPQAPGRTLMGTEQNCLQIRTGHVEGRPFLSFFPSPLNNLYLQLFFYN